MSRLRGFTLSELIIVTAILAVLAALLFPVTAKARTRAYLVQDISQMRQLYVAIDLYSQDSNDLLPPSLLYVEPYAKSTKVFCSPVDPYGRGIPGVADFPADMLDGDGPNLRSPFRISYAYLVPMAIYEGHDDNWISDRRNDPAYGLLAVSMYNDAKDVLLPQCQFDVYRIQLTEHRILMDGSYQEAHVQAGISWTCGIGGCFGENAPAYVGDPPYAPGCSVPIP